jgi:hypothetical protein
MRQFAMFMADNYRALPMIDNNPRKWNARRYSASKDENFVPRFEWVHDILNHCLMGRALLPLSDTLQAMEISDYKLPLSRLAQFVEHNYTFYCKWVLTSNKGLYSKYFEYEVGENGQTQFHEFAVLEEYEFRMLKEVLDRQSIFDSKTEVTRHQATLNQANNYFQYILDEVLQRNKVLSIMAIVGDLAILPWVERVIDSWIFDSPTPEYDKHHSTGLENLNWNIQNNPNFYIKYCSGENNEKLREQVRSHYRRINVKVELLFSRVCDENEVDFSDEFLSLVESFIPSVVDEVELVTV